MMNKILITPKINPDLDGVACAYAYAKYLNSSDKEHEYVAGIFGTPHSEAQFLINKFGINDILVLNPNEEFANFILVDASDLKGMPSVIRPQDVIEVIDHRETNQAQELFPQAKIQIEAVGAAATLILEKIKNAKFPLDSNSTFLLFGAIYSNTLNFKSSIVSARDIEAVSFLSHNATVEIPPTLINEMFRYKTEFISNNLEEVINSDFKSFEGSLGIAQIEAYDLEYLVKNRLDEIRKALSKLKSKYNLKYIFLTAADLNKGYNIFVVIDEDTKLLLTKSLELIFNSEGIAINSKLLLRKQILPFLINNLI